MSERIDSDAPALRVRVQSFQRLLDLNRKAVNGPHDFRYVNP